MLVRMLEIMPLEGEDKEAMASSKEAAPKGGTDNSSPKGKKRAASNDPETMASKRGENPHQRVRRRGVPRPDYALKGISPPASRKWRKDFPFEG